MLSNKNLYYFIILLLTLKAIAQEQSSLYKSIEWNLQQDTLFIPDNHLNSSYFEVFKKDGVLISAESYQIDFKNNQVILKDLSLRQDTLVVKYLKLPSFLTKSYSFYDQDRIVANEAGKYVFQHQEQKSYNFIPFEGLQTSGSLSRGLTMGNNQNAVTNSNLDLQITGKLSDKINLRASLQDSNAPLQNGGYSQKINEFDQIFIELFSDKWSIKAGDIFLENRNSRFLNFNKKVQGLATKFTFGNEKAQTTIETAGALARGQYTKSTFQGQEGNQGPYKLKGPNGELFILIISGSETVYVNGVILQRGENNDYVIDYNSGEIRFTTQFPITEDMRIAVEYQFTDRNYTRFVAYNNIQHKRETWNVGGTFFIESDLKNQPLQQSLTQEQVEILKSAGNDPNKMTAPSAYLDNYSENKILYTKKTNDEGSFYFEFSNNPNDELYTVYFSLVGNNNGDYIIENSQTNGKIYKYTSPLNGQPQGNYAPISKLIAPIRNTVASLNASYHPTEKTEIKIEGAFSNSDQNLFSTLEDEDNQGWATEIIAKQQLWSNTNLKLEAFANLQFVDKRFKSLENLYSIEFDRDWNLRYTEGSQSLFITGIKTSSRELGALTYQLETLKYGTTFKGNRHRLFGSIRTKRWLGHTENSFLKATSLDNETSFTRGNLQVKYHFDKNWVGSSISYENKEEKNQNTKQFNPLNHRFSEFKNFIGRGDSLGVYAEFGWIHRINDSIYNQRFKKVSTANTFYFKSKIIQNERRDLSFYLNHRTVNYTLQKPNKEQTLNSRITYNDQLFNGFIQLNTVYETSSGTIAQQEFTYIEVEPGQGVYMWNDYNNNGIQELEEFEVAPFPDQAIYVRLYLPNQVFVQTHQNKFSQSINLNPTQWQNNDGLKNILSHFHNQTSFLVDRNEFKTGNKTNFNPFNKNNDNLAGLNQSFRNSLFYNRGKQKHSITYTYLNTRSKNLLSYGSQENSIASQQLLYNHLIKKTWLLSFSSKISNQETLSETYDAKNYKLEIYSFEPKISYLFTQNTSLDIFYEFQQKENIISKTELLKQHQLGISFQYNSKQKMSVNGELAFYENAFNGNPYSPVAYQMLEGLQVGKNLTWRIMFQKNLTEYLDMSINYQGRSNEETNTIHTGTVQLRAFF